MFFCGSLPNYDQQVADAGHDGNNERKCKLDCKPIRPLPPGHRQVDGAYVEQACETC